MALGWVGAAATTLVAVLAVLSWNSPPVDGRVGVPGNSSPTGPDEPWGEPLRPLADAADGGGSRLLATPDDVSSGASHQRGRPPSHTRRNHSADRTRRIHCVDGMTGEPLAGVQLHVLPRTRAAWNAFEDAVRQAAHPMEVVHTLGVQAVSDAGGLARLELPDAAELLLLGAVDGRFAAVNAIRGAPGPWEVELWPLRSLSVQLVDAANEPVRGAELRLSYRWPKPMHIARCRTDDRGVAQFAFLELTCEGAKIELALPGATPLHEFPLAAFEPQSLPPPSTPLVVQLPRTPAAERLVAEVTMGTYDRFFLDGGIRCSDPPNQDPVLRGRVVDVSGQPLEAVSVAWARWGCTALDEGGSIAQDGAVFTAADGSFQLTLGNAKWEGGLELHRTDLVTVYPPIPEGGDLGTITMRSRCDVFGTVRLPPLASARDLELVAQLGYCHFRVPVHPDGSFTVSLYTPRRDWDRGLKLSLHGERWVGEPLDILSIPELAAGETDLGTLDLRPRIGRTRLAIVGDHGRPIERIDARLPGSSLPVFDVAGPTSRSQYEILDPYVHPEGGRRRLELRSPGGVYELHHRRECGVISLEANGWSVSDLQLSGGDQRLVLGRR